MTRRIGLLGLVLAAIGLAFLAAGGFAFAKTQAGLGTARRSWHERAIT